MGIIAGGINFILILGYGIVFFQMGDGVFTHPSFLSFIVSRQAIEILLSIIVLKYYHYKNYRTVFFLGIIVAILVIGQFVISYNILAFGRMKSLHFSSYLILIVSVMLFSLGLIYSNSGERLWLKRIGVASFAIGFILIPTLVFHGSEIVRQIHIWTNFSGTMLVIIFWIMNFSSELKGSKELTEAENS